MIERIVKMSFDPDKVEQFMLVFQQARVAISSFPGCRGLKLLQDTLHPHILFTYSIWERPEDLEAYRNSELFKTTWQQTKVLFNDKPMAWSVHVADLVK